MKMTVYAVFYVEYIEAIMEWSDHLEKLEKVFDSEAKAKEYVERKGGDYIMKEITVE
jgi:ABC-type Fe3+-hydroxamate transport system substrate-binding protein